MNEELKVKLGAALHEMWGRWIMEMFSQHGNFGPRGIFVIDADKASEWSKQANLPYDQLPEAQRALDNAEVMKIMN